MEASRRDRRETTSAMWHTVTLYFFVAAMNLFRWDEQMDNLWGKSWRIAKLTTSLGIPKTFPFDYQANVSEIIIEHQEDNLFPTTAMTKTGAGSAVKLKLTLIQSSKKREKGNLLVVSLHGGGFVSDTPHSEMGPHVAARLGVPTVAVQYRMAPKHSINESLADVIGTLRWLHDNSTSWEEFGLSRRPDVILTGTSAGGGLSLLTHHFLMTHPDLNTALGNPIKGFILSSPWVDLTGSFPSYKTYEKYDCLTPNMINMYQRDIIKAANGDKEELTRQSALSKDLRSVPPTFLCYGTWELLVDEDRQLAKKLKEAGGDVTVVEFPYMHHAFQIRLPYMEEARNITHIAAEWVKKKYQL